MGFIYQTYPIVGGTVLIVEQIESQNYQTGTTGWAIMADGDAEFNNLTARGELIVGNDPGQHIRVGRDSLGRPVVEYYSGSADETDPGYTRTSPLGQTRLEIASPLNVNAPGGSVLPEIDLQSWASSESTMNLWADRIAVNVPVLLDTTWTGLTGIMSNSWVDLAGARVGYFKDSTGRVQLRGEIISGTAALVYTLPAGYRPSQTMEWIMRAVGGVVMCAVQVATNGQITVTANLATAAANGIRLDAISFPTL